MAVESIEHVEPKKKRFHRYRMRTGMFAWIMHRITGLGLVLYLAIHVWGLRALGDRAEFNDLITKYHGPLYKIGEFLLLLAVVYHAINGLRIVLIDFMGWAPNQKRLFVTLGAVAIIIMVVGGYPVLYGVFLHFFG